MKQVVIYTTPTCPYCKLTKEFFAEHKIAYAEANVLTDMAKRQEMIGKSGQMGVPVTIVTDLPAQAGEAGKESIIVGFDKEGLSKALL